MYLLDTNVISEVRKRGDRRDARVVAWFAKQVPDALAISVITALELEQGTVQMERRDARNGALIRRWSDRVLAHFEGRILLVDLAVARACAQLNVPDRRPYRDGLIAATALTRGLTLVTRNRDFAPMGVPLLNPWEWGQTDG